MDHELFNKYDRHQVYKDLTNIKSYLPKKYEKLTIHSLRHSYASFLLENNIDMKNIQFLLGHSKLSTTSDIYIHITKNMSNKRVEINEKFDNYLTTFLNENNNKND